MKLNLTHNKLTDILPFHISSRLVHNGHNYSSLQALQLAEKDVVLTVGGATGPQNHASFGDC